MIDEFTAQFEALKGHVHTADTPARAVACILAVCEEAQATCLATAQLPQAIETALRDAVATTSLDLLTQPYAAKDLPLSIDKAQVGVTGIVHAIAETGTLVEVTTNDATRLVSSLPRTHIGVFHERDFIHGLRESASTLRKIFTENDQDCVVSFLSGPSRTGDIEMRLTLGVHGPEIAHALILTGEEF
ncbi:MAG: hypothetical protein COA73_14775 [Candidatus Hydrogenedentota bacterium]|nr:MAG: hypothetical protein COA73_14775 [Candidatus Hydrogenedentota bacterium]